VFVELMLVNLLLVKKLVVMDGWLC